MIRLPSDDEKNDETQRVLEPTTAAEGLKTTIPVSNPAATSIEEDEVKIPAKELEKYFFYSSADQSSSPTSQCLQTTCEGLEQTFRTDLTALAC